MADIDSIMKIADQEGVIVVEFATHRLVDEDVVAGVERKLLELVAAKTSPRLVVSFGNIRHLSSSMLGSLVVVHKRSSEKAGRIRLLGLDPTVMKIFKTTRLHKIFPVDKDLETALKRIKK